MWTLFNKLVKERFRLLLKQSWWTYLYPCGQTSCAIRAIKEKTIARFYNSIVFLLVISCMTVCKPFFKTTSWNGLMIKLSYKNVWSFHPSKEIWDRLAKIKEQNDVRQGYSVLLKVHLLHLHLSVMCTNANTYKMRVLRI